MLKSGEIQPVQVLRTFPGLIWELRNAGESHQQKPRGGNTFSHRTLAASHDRALAVRKGNWIQTPSVTWFPLDTQGPESISKFMTDHDSRTALGSKAWLEAHSSLLCSCHQFSLNPCRIRQRRKIQQRKQMSGQQLLSNGRCGGMMELPPSSGDTQALDTSQTGKVETQLPLGRKN